MAVVARPRARWPPPSMLHRSLSFGGARALASVGLAAALNGVFLAAFFGSGKVVYAMALAFLPIAALAFAALVASDQSILAFAALGFGISINVFQAPLVGHSLFAADALAVLAITVWVSARLLGKNTARRPAIAAGLRGAGALFVFFWGIALIRGHEHFGQKLYGEPLRLVLYAAIGLSLTELTPRKAHRGVVTVLYAGTVWMLLNTLYLMATGGSATDSADLSTGGSRYVALTIAMYLASALYLALLNLELATTPRAAMLHLAIAGIALFQIIVSFGRTTFIGVAVGVLFVVFSSQRARQAIGQLLPLAAPVLVAAALLVSIAWPRIPATLVARLNIGVVTSHADPSVDWRLIATREIMRQFHSSPFFGVGFGKGASFTLNGTTYQISQDPHNSYVLLLAAGGITLLASFALLVIACSAAIVSRLRRADGVERIILLWSLASLFTFLLNAAAGPILSTPDALLAIWVLLLLPLAMRRPDVRASVEEEPLPLLPRR